jgi:hypothetical protein
VLPAFLQRSMPFQQPPGAFPHWFARVGPLCKLALPERLQVEPAGMVGLLGPAGMVGLLGPAGMVGLLEPAGIVGLVGPAGIVGLVGPQLLV